jgi:hypothetical protein
MKADGQLDHAIGGLLKFCSRAWTTARFPLLLAAGVYLSYIFVDIRSTHNALPTFTVVAIANRTAYDLSALFSNFGLFRSIGHAFSNLASLGEQSPSLFLSLSSTLTTVAVLFCLCG